MSGEDGCKSILNVIVVWEEDRDKLLDVKEFRGAGEEILDHHLLLAKIRCLRR